MTDPPRWLEEGSDAPEEARELLRHAPRSRPLDRATLVATAAVVTELGARPAIAAALAKLVALPQAIAALPVAAKLVTSIAMVSAVAIVAVPTASAPRARSKAVMTSAASDRSPSPNPIANPIPISIPTPIPIQTPIPIPIPIPIANPVPTPVSAPRAMRVVRASTLAPSSSVVSVLAPEPATPIDTLAAEVAALDGARAALASSPARALRLADTHATAFPEATLAAERELIAIDALLRLGRRTEARLRADRLRTRFPGGLYESRLSALLE
jgi:hypothetical protein